MRVSLEDVDASATALTAAGAAPLHLGDDQPWGKRLAYVAAPDGTPVMQVASAG